MINPPDTVMVDYEPKIVLFTGDGGAVVRSAGFSALNIDRDDEPEA